VARLNLAGRQLLRAAIAIRSSGLRDGRYPDAPRAVGLDEPNVLTGRPLTYRREADGSVRVEIPGVTGAELGEPATAWLLAVELPPMGLAGR
jgi:hypothetical protein